MGIRMHHVAAYAAAMAALLGVLVMLTAGPVMAQAVPNEAAKSRIGETTGQAERVRRAQSLSEAADALPSVSFSDVMASPDDPAVNLRYAKEMVLQGNIQLAAATVERILLLYPEANDVRLLYAILLFRMDVVDDAAAQLDILEAANPSDAIRAEIANYRKLIANRQNPLKRSASLAFGMHFDTNRNSYPDSETFLVGGVETPGTSEEIDDWGRLAIGAATISRDTGRQQLQQVFADAAALYDDQVEVDAIDVRALLVNTGFLYKSAYGDFLPGAHAGWIDLKRNKYSRDYAVSLRWQRPLFQGKIAGFVDVRHGWRNFNNTTGTPFATEQNGHYQRVEAGGRKVIDPTMWVNASVAYNRIAAALDYESYDGYEISADITKVLPRSTYITLTANVERQLYNGPLPFVSARTRRDTDYGVDLTYGIPLATIGELAFGSMTLPETVRPVVLNLTAAYQNSDSNLLNYDYHNYRGQFLFSRSWDF